MEHAPADPTALERLASLPTAGLGHWPTPLHPLARFGAELDADVWIKRDDVQGVTLAGNKVRKFDLVMGQALADGCDTVVTTGAAQSNSARTGAAAAAALGMDCVLLLSGDEPSEPTGNLFLDHLLGSDVRFAGRVGWRELNDGVDEIVSNLNATGHKAFAAPVGCSSPLGTLGFAKAFVEFHQQCDALGLRPSAIVHASTSGGTHAGLLVGRSLVGSEIPIVAVDVGAFMAAPKGLLAMARRSAELIGHELTLTEDQILVVTDQIGDGYGRPTPAGTTAIETLARTEAIVTDPVYSGKGLAGLVDGIGNGTLASGADHPIVFWHTGGYHALFDPARGNAQLAGPGRG